MNNAEKYLGYSKLTSEYEGFFFSDINMKIFKSRVGKILKSTDEEIIFITSEKYEDKDFGLRLYSIRVLKRFEGRPDIRDLTDEKFPSSAKAIAYYKKVFK
jgi:hypothetical protein